MRRFNFVHWLSILPLVVLFAGSVHGQSTDVLTWRNNNLRDGLNSAETTLTQATVTSSNFGKICSTASGAIDGQIFAQPLVVTGGIRGYNHVVYVETMNDTVYFIDGDSTNCAVINHFSLLQNQEEAVQCADVGARQCAPFYPVIGILGTPVIDTTTKTMYLVTWSESVAGSCSTVKTPSCFAHRLHALNIANGTEKYNGPVTLPSVTIGISTFSSFDHIQRPGLLLLPKVEANGDSSVYVAFSEMDGGGTIGVSIPNGWVFSFDAQDLSVAPVAWTTTPNGEGGGIWMSGAGLAAGKQTGAGGEQYIYLSTGDGTFDAEKGGSDYGDSFVKLTTGLRVSGYFTPYKQYCDDVEDLDFGSGGIMLIPDGIGSNTIDFALASGKDGNTYVMDRANPGGYAGPATKTCPTSAWPNLNYETFRASTTAFYSTAAYWNRNLYSVANNSPLRKHSISATACAAAPVCVTPSASSSVNFGFGPVPVVSSNGDTTGTAVVWAIFGHEPYFLHAHDHLTPAVLYAFDAEHITSPGVLPELWNSSQCPNRDRAGGPTKFSVPTIANGRVFMGTIDPTDATNTRGQLDVYGAINKPCN